MVARRDDRVFPSVGSGVILWVASQESGEGRFFGTPNLPVPRRAITASLLWNRT